MKKIPVQNGFTEKEWASLSPLEKVEVQKAIHLMKQRGEYAAPSSSITIEKLACKMLLHGEKYDDILLAIFEQFPNARTSYASLRYYRHKLKEEGYQFP